MSNIRFIQVNQEFMLEAISFKYPSVVDKYIPEIKWDMKVEGGQTEKIGTGKNLKYKLDKKYLHKKVLFRAYIDISSNEQYPLQSIVCYVEDEPQKIYIQAVSGAETAKVGDYFTCEVTQYSIETKKVTDSTKKAIKWDVMVDDKKELLLYPIVRVPAMGEKITFLVPSSWNGKTVTIMPYMNSSSAKVAVRLSVGQVAKGECICKAYNLVWGKKISCIEKKKVISVSKNLGVDPNWLMIVIALETAEKFSPSIDNGIGYVGLIQFGEAAAKTVGSTRDALKQMSFIEQMDYVEKFLNGRKSKYKTITDLYLSVLYPTACGHGSEKNYIVLEGKAYKSNPLFFKEEDEYATKMINGKKVQVANAKSDGKTYVWEIDAVVQEMKTKGEKFRETVFSCIEETKGECSDTWDSVTNKKISELHPKVQCAAKNFINEVDKTLNIKLRITQGLRTIAEQDDLYAQGRTKPGSIVTKAKGGESMHNYGLAIDVAEIKNGKIDWNEQETVLPKIAPIGKKWGFAWGGDWKSFKDKPHFEMTFGKTLLELKKIYEESGKQINKMTL